MNDRQFLNFSSSIAPRRLANRALLRNDGNRNVVRAFFNFCSSQKRDHQWQK
jgi:hypothetical protein